MYVCFACRQIDEDLESVMFREKLFQALHHRRREGHGSIAIDGRRLLGMGTMQDDFLRHGTVCARLATVGRDCGRQAQFSAALSHTSTTKFT